MIRRIFSVFRLRELEGFRCLNRHNFSFPEKRVPKRKRDRPRNRERRLAAHLDDELYPGSLREIFDPPPVLWVIEMRDFLDRPSIAVVGTRKPTAYGSGVAEMLARDSAVRRVLILSGMARGAEYFVAHRGALAAKGQTVGSVGHRNRRDLP